MENKKLKAAEIYDEIHGIMNKMLIEYMFFAKRDSCGTLTPANGRTLIYTAIRYAKEETQAYIEDTYTEVNEKEHHDYNYAMETVEDIYNTMDTFFDMCFAGEIVKKEIDNMTPAFIETEVRDVFMKHYISASLMMNSGIGLRDRKGDACCAEWCAYDATLNHIEHKISEPYRENAAKYLRQMYTICFRHSNCDHDDEFPF